MELWFLVFFPREKADFAFHGVVVRQHVFKVFRIKWRFFGFWGAMLLVGLFICGRRSVDGCSPHHMLLQTGRYQVGRDGCLPIGCFSETDVTRLAVMDAPHRMLPETGRYQVVAGMDAPSMLLRTGRDQVGSDGCSPYRMLLDTGRAAMDARPIAYF